MGIAGRCWKRVRQSLRRRSRREIAARVLGVPDVTDADDGRLGLVLVQIDGFSKTQFERAVSAGRMPFLKRLLRRERYRLGTFYSGQPATTPSVQAELLYGTRCAVPAFSFRESDDREVVDLLDPETARRLELEAAAAGGPGLLAGGSAYCDIYDGGAAETHFCVSRLTYREVLRRLRPWKWPALSLLYLPTALKTLCLAAVELVRAAAEAAAGVLAGQPFNSEFEFIDNRVLVGVVAREWMVHGAGVDTARGLPVVHLNFLVYDEMAHRRGPGSAFAHRSLPAIDRAIRRIARAARRSRRRDYEVWVYSDHGQEATTPFDVACGRSIGDAVEAAVRSADANREAAPVARPAVSVVAIGPVGHVYLDPLPDAARRTRLAEALVREAKVPAAYVADAAGVVRFWTATATGTLPDDADALLGEGRADAAEVATDLACLCRHPDAGQVVIGGWAAGRAPISFVGEHGAHAGPGREETQGFTLLPPDVPGSGGRLRPGEFREAALARMSAAPGNRPAACDRAEPRRGTIRLVTYNVHGCVGVDGRLSPRRIARSIAACDPDLVSLQELDVGRRRSGGRDQARDIADELGMSCEFHASLEVAGERYGNAVLGRFPLRVVKAGPLPPRPRRPSEPRGALWVEADLGGEMLQLVVTHFGLAGAERRLQAETLLGPEWLAGPIGRGEPVLLCGDLNAWPGSAPYRAFSGVLRDAAAAAGRTRPTFPSRWPLVRIDHVFASAGIQVVSAEAVRTSLTRQASDHLPLVIEFEWPQRELQPLPP